MISLETPYNALPLGVGRRVDPRIAAVEAVQLIGAFCDEDGLIKRAAPRLLEYADEGKLHGAYGRRIGYQTRNVITKLKADPYTRQAVITLWDPWLDNLHDKHDYPCTVALQFRVRDGRLEMNTLMRSNDVWLGLPYDMFQFTQLQITLSRVLGVEAGAYTHFAGSLHLYVRDAEKAKQMLNTVSLGVHDYQPEGIGDIGQSITEVELRARSLAQQTIRTPFPMTRSEAWYRDYVTAKLTPHVG